MSSILIRRANMVSGGVTPRMPAGYIEPVKKRGVL